MHPRAAAVPTGSGIRFVHLVRAVRARLAHARYRHVLGVARMAEKLARRYGISRDSARMAAILHDIARQWTPDALVAYAAEHRIAANESERAAPILLHAKVAADIARREFGVADEDVLAAIETHTVAVPGMSDLQKVIFLADTFEPSRTFPARAALEAAALRSLDEGMLACVKASLEYLMSRDVPIAPQTLEVYNTLVRGNNGATS
ncbi:MAG TPA: bis(5'-nucleosyl)-tetraphosphatase (symmetrical) YqeK [Candidatus Eremiobacteraceae bacterium]|nr:bis(5'-nucleosyl)-tetraphosphatase (symmetrical) YqeK [Candidatus Eremiobacteraceae bacterium]